MIDEKLKTSTLFQGFFICQDLVGGNLVSEETLTPTTMSLPKHHKE
jgi:hypothetical protein